MQTKEMKNLAQIPTLTNSNSNRKKHNSKHLKDVKNLTLTKTLAER